MCTKHTTPLHFTFNEDFQNDFEENFGVFYNIKHFELNKKFLYKHLPLVCF